MVYITGPPQTEDAAHASGDRGLMVLAVRQDGDGSLTDADGDYCALLTNAYGYLKTEPHLFRGAFGEQIVAHKTPQIQYSFPTHLDAMEWDVSGDGSCTATVSAATATATVDTGTTSETCSITLSSHQRVIYHAGEGLLIQFSARFNSGDANCQALMGFGTPGTDGFFFGYSGTDFGIFHFRGGAQQSFTAQASWSVDRMDGTAPNPSGVTLAPGDCNVYFIQCQLHYMGDIFFYVVGGGRRTAQLVHVITWANNAQSTTTMLSGTRPLTMYAAKTSATVQAATVESASMAAFTEGLQLELGRQRFFDVEVTALATATETALFSVRNPATILGGTTNNAVLVVNLVTANLESGGNAGMVRVRRGAHFGDINFVDDAWTEVNYSSSVAEYMDHSASAKTLNAVANDSAHRFSAATATTVQLPAEAAYPATEDYFVGRVLCITGGTGAGQYRKVKAYSAGRVCTVERFATTPSTSDSVFRIENGHILTAVALGRRSAVVHHLHAAQLIHIPPGDHVTVSVQGEGTTPDFHVGLGWTEVG